MEQFSNFAIFTRHDLIFLHTTGIEDYWTPIPANVSVQDPSLPRRHVDIMVGPKHYKHVTSYLTCQVIRTGLAK